MNKIIVTIATVFLFFSIVSISAMEIDSYISSSGTVEENDWLYTGLTSYQGNNTASFEGNKTGYGVVEYIEQKDLFPNSTACYINGDPLGELSCTSSVDPNNKSQTRGRYTNLVGSATVTVSMVD